MYVLLHVSAVEKKDAEGNALDIGYIKDSTWTGLLSSDTPFFLGFFQVFGRNTPALVLCRQGARTTLQRRGFSCPCR